MSDAISRHGTSAWLDNMGHPNLAKMIMDEKRFPPVQSEKFYCKDCKTRPIDLVIANQAYVLDALRAYREVIDSGCCNDCGSMKDCEFVPKPGQLVRYNCPFYERKEIKDGN